MTRRLAMLLPLTGIFLLACQNTDYYSLFMAHGCQPGESELTPACREAILNQSNIDVASFAGHEEGLEALVKAIHMGLNAPLAFPKDKKMFGLATLEEAQMYDFVDTFLKEDQKNLNQLVTNYILNSAHAIKSGCSSSPYAWYDANYPSTIYICDSLSRRAIPLVLLFHEARHQSIGHPITCKSLWGQCDKGMDGAFSWQLALSWGLLQGNGLVPRYHASALSIEELKLVVSEMFAALSGILALPPSLQETNMEEFQNHYAGSFLEGGHFLEIEGLIMPSHLQSVTFVESSLPISSDFDPWMMTTGDFNEDKRPDLALLSSEKIGIVLNQGQSSFQAKTPFALTSCSGYSSIRAVDIDGDRHLDLLILCDRGEKVLLWGKGDGAFLSPIVLKTLTYSFEPMVDLDHNGTLDFVGFTSYGSGKVVIALTGRDRTFTYKEQQLLLFSNSRFLIDTDRDRVADLVVNEIKGLEIYKGLGDGTFAKEPRFINLPFLSGKEFFFSKDMNWDGLPDLIALQDSERKLLFLLGQGDGTFSAPILVDWVKDLPLVLDVNQDGYLDMVSFDTQYSGEILLSISFGSSWIDARTEVKMPFLSGLCKSPRFATEDFNQDGSPDLVALCHEGTSGGSASISFLLVREKREL